MQELHKYFRQYEQQSKRGLKHDYSLKDISELFGISYRSILYKFKRYKQSKLPLLPHPLPRRRPGPHGQNPELIAYRIRECLKIRSFRSATDICLFINSKFGATYSRAVVARQLRGLQYRIPGQQFIPLKSSDVVGCIRLVLKEMVEGGRLMVCFAEKMFESEDWGLIYVSVLCSAKGMRYRCAHIENDKDVQIFFAEMLGEYQEMFGLEHNWLLLTGVE
jgi:hypothetical protein